MAESGVIGSPWGTCPFARKCDIDRAGASSFTKMGHYANDASQVSPMPDFTSDPVPLCRSLSNGFCRTAIHWILFELGYPPALLPARRRHRPPFVLTAARALCPQAGAFDSSTRDQIFGRHAMRRHAVRRVVPFLAPVRSRVGPLVRKLCAGDRACALV